MNPVLVFSNSIFLLLASIFVVSETTHLYFATTGGGLKSYSLATSEVSTVVETDEYLEGVTYDPTSNKIYYCNNSHIYRANTDGTGIEVLKSNIEWRVLNGISTDWVTGNLYAVGYASSSEGIYVCNTSSSSLVCTTFMISGSFFIGIALDPLQGEMFIGGIYGIYRANMDGTNFTSIARFTSGAGIVVDPDSDRLYWTDQGSWRIASSHRDGSGIETAVELVSSVSAYGLAKLGNVLYWTDLHGFSLQSSTITGEDVGILYNGTYNAKHLTLVPAQEQSGFGNENYSTKNPCEGQGCSHICALKARSVSCLCPQGLHLAEDQRTCVQTSIVN